MVAQRLDQFSECLRRIDMKPSRVVRQTLGHLIDGLNDSRLIIRMHQGNQKRGRPDPLQ